MLRLTFEGVPKLVASQLISYTPHLDRLACVQPYNFGAPNSEYYGSSMFSPFVPSPIITAWLRLVLMCVAVGCRMARTLGLDGTPNLCCRQHHRRNREGSFLELDEGKIYRRNPIWLVRPMVASWKIFPQTWNSLRSGFGARKLGYTVADGGFRKIFVCAGHPLPPKLLLYLFFFAKPRHIVLSTGYECWRLTILDFLDVPSLLDSQCCMSWL